MTLHFVTGRLAEPALRATLEKANQSYWASRSEEQILTKAAGLDLFQPDADCGRFRRRRVGHHVVASERRAQARDDREDSRGPPHCA